MWQILELQTKWGPTDFFFCISDVLLLLLAYVEVIDESKQVEQKILFVRSIGILASFQSNHFFFLSYKLAKHTVQYFRVQLYPLDIFSQRKDFTISNRNLEECFFISFDFLVCSFV